MKTEWLSVRFGGGGGGYGDSFTATHKISLGDSTRPNEEVGEGGGVQLVYLLLCSDGYPSFKGLPQWLSGIGGRGTEEAEAIVHRNRRAVSKVIKPFLVKCNILFKFDFSQNNLARYPSSHGDCSPASFVERRKKSAAIIGALILSLIVSEISSKHIFVLTEFFPLLEFLNIFEGNLISAEFNLQCLLCRGRSQYKQKWFFGIFNYFPCITFFFYLRIYNIEY